MAGLAGKVKDALKHINYYVKVSSAMRTQPLEGWICGGRALTVSSHS